MVTIIVQQNNEAVLNKQETGRGFLLWIVLLARQRVRPGALRPHEPFRRRSQTAPEKSVKTINEIMMTCHRIGKSGALKMRDLRRRNGNKQSAEWKQMEHIGNKMAVLLPIVSIASFLNPQGLGKKPAMRCEAKTVKKAQRKITRGCLHVR
jgi:hypothetical protein